MSGPASRRPWLAALLSLGSSGLGLLYAGQPLAALGWCVAPQVGYALLVGLALVVPGAEALLFVGVGFLALSWPLQGLVAWRAARRAGATFRPARFNRVPVYVAFFVFEFVWSRASALLVRSQLLEPFRVSSNSMRPGLLPGDQVFVAKRGHAAELHHGDIAVVRRADREPGTGEHDLVFRVVALGGETVEGADGALRVNGEALRQVPCATPETRFWEEVPGLPPEEVRVRCTLETARSGKRYEVAWSEQPAGSGSFAPVELAATQLFLMGDWRDRANDDRLRGPSDRGQLVGRAAVVWFSYSPVDGVRWSRIGQRL